MKKLLLYLTLLLVTTSASRACLNVFHSVDAEGHLHTADEVLKKFNTNFNKQLHANKLQKLEKQLKIDHSYKTLSDYTVSLMKLGKTTEAVEILKKLSVRYPNEYVIAANLGTGYELKGELDSALKYIKRGIELNPNSHSGSEWVHIKILETKLKLRKTPSYLTQNSILQLTEAQKKDTLIRKQINIQIRERFPFTPRPDKIMGQLLVEYGDCVANTLSIEYAKAIYQISKEYFVYKLPQTDEKIKKMQELIKQYQTVEPQRRDPQYPEEDHVKLRGLTYQQCLGDNDPTRYVVNWSSINTNITSLLEMAWVN